MSDDSIRSKYHVIKIEKTTAPEGLSGEDWYLYVIQKGGMANSIMECKTTGTLKSVTAHANEQVETLNFRNVKGGRR